MEIFEFWFNYHQQILEYIKKESYILLPNNILTSLAELNAEQFNKLYNLQENVLTAINKFNASINKLNEVYNINNQNNGMNKRFNTLLNLISKNNSHNKQREILMRHISMII